jgi:bifunctional ADP-heptose synthase (sugar kinase/adenylyltransferase)
LAPRKVLVIGESCLDVFTYCEASRLAPDLPVPVLEKVASIETPGMAHNVYNNLLALGIEAEMLTNQDWRDHRKERLVHKKTNHTFLRLDSRHQVVNDFRHPDYSQFGVVIISDYDKGYLSEETIAEICSKHPMVLLDTKKQIGEYAQECFLIKINSDEAARSESTLGDFDENLIVTLGPAGAKYRGEIYEQKEVVDVFDTSGAGDSFIASLASTLVMGLSVTEAIIQANIDAASVVRKKGVSLIERT